MRVELAKKLSDRDGKCDVDLLDDLNASLHAMSQPLTVLLCMLEYGAGLEATDEMKVVVGGGLEQCLRLMNTVRAMQKEVMRAARWQTA